MKTILVPPTRNGEPSNFLKEIVPDESIVSLKVIPASVDGEGRTKDMFAAPPVDDNGGGHGDKPDVNTVLLLVAERVVPFPMQTVTVFPVWQTASSNCPDHVEVATVSTFVVTKLPVEDAGVLVALVILPRLSTVITGIVDALP